MNTANRIVKIRPAKDNKQWQDLLPCGSHHIAEAEDYSRTLFIYSKLLISYSKLGVVPQRRIFGDCWTRMFYKSNTIPVTQPTAMNSRVYQHKNLTTSCQISSASLTRESTTVKLMTQYILIICCSTKQHNRFEEDSRMQASRPFVKQKTRAMSSCQTRLWLQRNVKCEPENQTQNQETWLNVSLIQQQTFTIIAATEAPQQHHHT